MKLGDLQISENLYDIILLLGVNYTKLYFFEPGDNLMDLLPLHSSQFSNLLDEIIYKLKSAFTSKEITKKFKLPKRYFEIFGNTQVRSGHCCICDAHFYCIRSHLLLSHCLPRELGDSYMVMFPYSKYKMPKEYKDFQMLYDPLFNIKNKVQAQGKKETVEKSSQRITIEGQTVRNGACICKKCGKVISKADESRHMTAHTRYELFCPYCNTRVKKNSLQSHVCPIKASLKQS